MPSRYERADDFTRRCTALAFSLGLSTRKSTHLPAAFSKVALSLGSSLCLLKVAATSRNLEEVQHTLHAQLGPGWRRVCRVLVQELLSHCEGAPGFAQSNAKAVSDLRGVGLLLDEDVGEPEELRIWLPLCSVERRARHGGVAAKRCLVQADCWNMHRIGPRSAKQRPRWATHAAYCAPSLSKDPGIPSTHIPPLLEVQPKSSIQKIPAPLEPKNQITTSHKHQFTQCFSTFFAIPANVASRPDNPAIWPD